MNKLKFHEVCPACKMFIFTVVDSRTTIAKPITTINDIREKYFAGKKLTASESQAMRNFERYQLQLLSLETQESSFHRTYLYLQVKANLSPFEDFLKDEFLLP